MNSRCCSLAPLLSLVALASVLLAADDSVPSLSGAIVDDKGEPVTDAEVALQGPGYHETITGNDGTYQFLDAIEPGEYRLRVKSTRWVGLSDWQKLPRVQIIDGKPVSKDLTLRRACRVEVRVIDTDGHPVHGVSIYCQSLRHQEFGNAQSFNTDREGKAIVGGLLPTPIDYLIAAHHKNYAIAKATVKVTDPEEITTCEFELEEGVSIKGIARCTDGNPPAGWEIRALPTWWKFGSYPDGAKIAEDGTFELPHVGEGEFNVSISIPLGNGRSAPRRVLAAAKLAPLAQPISVTLDYPSPGSNNYLTGTVRWIGKPLERGLNVSAYSDELQEHFSGQIAEGAKEFKLGPMKPGTYRFRCDHPELEVLNLRKIKNLDDLDHVKVPNEKPVQLVLRVRGKPIGSRE